MMFKTWSSRCRTIFGDDRAEFLINNRLSFMRFLGLNVTPIFHLGPTGIAG